MFATLFGLSGRLDRRSYLAYAIPLVALKYGVDALAVRTVTGQVWTPLDYLSPLLSTRHLATGLAPPTWLLVAMAMWALPFLWIGVSMTARRGLDAGLSPWLCLGFFVPYLNWVYFAVLAALPSKPPPAQGPADASEPEERLRSAMLAVLVGVVIVAAAVGCQVLLFKAYSASLFMGTPFSVGVAAGYFYNRRVPRGPRETVGLACFAVTLAAASVLLFALEGAVCVAMALPLALLVAVPGAHLGRYFALERARGWIAPTVALCLLPLSGSLTPPAPLREVISTVEIDAPPEQVWDNVVSFSELPPPAEVFFKLGIAWPQRAHIEGRGVGAVRHCEFSTGAFVEPITVWDAPHRLAFDVAAQPPPMTEWSPYRHVHPPHLDGTMRSRRGEFRLIALPGGRTRLEGSTWYTLELGPQAYWAPFADALVHAIHLRVLRHVRALSEARGS